MAAGLLFTAVSTGQMDAISKLLEEDDTLVNARNGSGQTPLHVATSLCSLPLLQLLLSYGASVNARTDARFGGLAALHVAARYDSLEVGRALLQGGADPNVRSEGGSSTPLQEAAKFGSQNFAVWLLSVAGIDAAATDAAGFSAAYYAKKAGHAALAKLLPAPKFDLWQQLQSEPNYEQNMASIKEAMEKKEKLAAKKAEALEKKKKKK